MYCVLLVCLVPTEGRKGIGSPGIGVTVDCELPCGFWELNLCPLEEQPVLLTAEPSFNLQSIGLEAVV